MCSIIGHHTSSLWPHSISFVLFFFFEESWLIPLLLWGRGGCSGALGGADPLPLHHHGLLAAQDGAGPEDGSHTQVWVVFVLADHVPDATQGGPSVLVCGGPH